MTRQLAIMEKGVIMFKDNSRLKVFRFFAKLLGATAVRYVTQYSVLLACLCGCVAE